MVRLQQLVFVLMCFAFHNALGQTKNTNAFDTLRYDKVIAYDYNGSPQLQIVVDGQLLRSQNRIFQQKELTKQQIDKLNKTLGDTKTYGGSTAACFDPHIGFVYYYQNNIVGHISICLDCNYLQSSPTISATKTHPSTLCEECYNYGFSKTGRIKLSRLVKEFKFSHWKLNSDLFDK